MEFIGVTICFADQNQKDFSGFQIPESEAEGSATALLRVLVVDDERLLADTTAAILRLAGFDAKTAYDGFAALQTMVSFHPHYLITDIVMPAMNGVELAITITKMYPATKILLFSGQAGITDILEESKAKGFEFPLLGKPVHPTKLIESIKSLRNG